MHSVKTIVQCTFICTWGTGKATDNTISPAHHDAKESVSDLNMYEKHGFRLWKNCRRSLIVDDSHSNQHDQGLDSRTDDRVSSDDDQESDTSDPRSVDGDNDEDNPEDSSLNVSSTSFQEMRVSDSTTPDLAKSSFIVDINGQENTFIHKGQHGF